MCVDGYTPGALIVKLGTADYDLPCAVLTAFAGVIDTSLLVGFAIGVSFAVAVFDHFYKRGR